MEEKKNRNKRAGHLVEKYLHFESSLDDLPKEFRDLFAEFTEIAKNAPEPCWYVKYAVLYFTYEGKPYAIGPGTLDTEGRIFDSIEWMLSDRLYELGAYDMFYSGMLD